MILIRKHVVVVVSLCVIIVAIYTAYTWYRRYYVWPIEIQQQLLGKTLAPPSSLIEYEGFSHYAQGLFRWTYKVEVASEVLASLCGDQAVDICVLKKSRVISKDVSQTANYNAGILTITEEWN